MREHILCGTDFTEGAGWAFERAILVAGASGLPVRLVHVMEESAQGGETVLGEALASQAGAAAGRGVVIETDLIKGSPHESLAQLAAREGCRLLVMGPRTETGLQSWLLGSTVEAVIRACVTPALLVHSPPPRPYQRILAGLDLEGASLAAVASVRALGLCPPAELAVVHAFSPMVRRTAFISDMASEDEAHVVEKAGNEALSKVLEQIERIGYSRGTMPTFVEDGEPYAVIRAAVDRWGADLLVLGSHGRAPIVELFLGSTARSALREAPCDVLVQRIA